jgi:hypothetical protein
MNERPADLPAKLSTKFEFVINLRTAKALGIDMSTSLLPIFCYLRPTGRNLIAIWSTVQIGALDHFGHLAGLTMATRKPN